MVSYRHSPLAPPVVPYSIKNDLKSHFDFTGYPSVTRLHPVFITDLPQRVCSFWLLSLAMFQQELRVTRIALSGWCDLPGSQA